MVDTPASIGRYRVLGVVGKGAMGVVYRAVDDALDREVAIKVMSTAQLEDPESRERFLREARAAARLAHPNIVTIYELGEHEGSLFMAMEYLEGVDLQQAIHAGMRPDPRHTLPIVMHVLAGLGQAHDHGIVHRDVKPSNVFLPRGRAAKVMDFGVARLGAGLTAAGAMVGTPNYMAPEQVHGGVVDGRSDLFSAGLILFELVTGEKAYEGNSIATVLFKIAQGSPDLKGLPRGPEWAPLRRVLERALAHDPDARYPEARAMEADLQEALDAFGGAAAVSTRADRAVLGRAARPAAPAAAPPAPAPPAPRPTPVAPPPPPSPVPAAPARRPAVPPRRGGNGPIVLASLLGVATLGLVVYGLTLALKPRLPRLGDVRPSPATASQPAQFPTTPTLAPAPPGSVPVMTLGAAPPRPAASPQPSARAIPSAAPSGGAVFYAPTTPSVAPLPTLRSTTEPAGSVEHATDLFEHGRYAAAMAEARAVLRREPGNAQARSILEDAEAGAAVESRVRLANDALRRGDRQAALEHVRAGLAVAPADARLLALFRELQ